jgi:uncharacterized membrane protein YgcG
MFCLTTLLGVVLLGKNPFFWFAYFLQPDEQEERKIEIAKCDRKEGKPVVIADTEPAEDSQPEGLSSKQTSVSNWASSSLKNLFTSGSVKNPLSADTIAAEDNTDPSSTAKQNSAKNWASKSARHLVSSSRDFLTSSQSFITVSLGMKTAAPVPGREKAPFYKIDLIAYLTSRVKFASGKIARLTEASTGNAALLIFSATKLFIAPAGGMLEFVRIAFLLFMLFLSEVGKLFNLWFRLFFSVYLMLRVKLSFEMELFQIDVGALEAMRQIMRMFSEWCSSLFGGLGELLSSMMSILVEWAAEFAVELNFELVVSADCPGSTSMFDVFRVFLLLVAIIILVQSDVLRRFKIMGVGCYEKVTATIAAALSVLCFYVLQILLSSLRPWTLYADFFHEYGAMQNAAGCLTKVPTDFWVFYAMKFLVAALSAPLGVLAMRIFNDASADPARFKADVNALWFGPLGKVVMSLIWMCVVFFTGIPVQAWQYTSVSDNNPQGAWWGSMRPSSDSAQKDACMLPFTEFYSGGACPFATSTFGTGFAPMCLSMLATAAMSVFALSRLYQLGIKTGKTIRVQPEGTAEVESAIINRTNEDGTLDITFEEGRVTRQVPRSYVFPDTTTWPEHPGCIWPSEEHQFQDISEDVQVQIRVGFREPCLFRYFWRAVIGCVLAVLSWVTVLHNSTGTFTTWISSNLAMYFWLQLAVVISLLGLVIASALHTKSKLSWRSGRITQVNQAKHGRFDPKQESALETRWAPLTEIEPTLDIVFEHSNSSVKNVPSSGNIKQSPGSTTPSLSVFWVPALNTALAVGSAVLIVYGLLRWGVWSKTCYFMYLQHVYNSTSAGSSSIPGEAFSSVCVSAQHWSSVLVCFCMLLLGTLGWYWSGWRPEPMQRGATKFSKTNSARLMFHKVMTVLGVLAFVVVLFAHSSVPTVCPSLNVVSCSANANSPSADDATPSSSTNDAGSSGTSSGSGDGGGSTSSDSSSGGGGGSSSGGWRCPAARPYAYSGGVNCCSDDVGFSAESCFGTTSRCPSGQSENEMDMCSNAVGTSTSIDSSGGGSSSGTSTGSSGGGSTSTSSDSSGGGSSSGGSIGSSGGGSSPGIFSPTPAPTPPASGGAPVTFQGQPAIECNGCEECPPSSDNCERDGIFPQCGMRCCDGSSILVTGPFSTCKPSSRRLLVTKNTSYVGILLTQEPPVVVKPLLTSRFSHPSNLAFFARSAANNRLSTSPRNNRPSYETRRRFGSPPKQAARRTQRRKLIGDFFSNCFVAAGPDSSASTSQSSTFARSSASFFFFARSPSAVFFARSPGAIFFARSGSNASTPPSSTCQDMENLAQLTSPYTSTTALSGNQISSCGTFNGKVFFIQLAPGESITIAQTANSFDSQHETRWGGSCPGDFSVICTDDDDYESHTWANAEGQSQNVYFIVDAYSGAGVFTIAWQAGSPTPLSSLPSCSSTAINFDLPHTCSSGCIDASGGGGSCSTCQCPGTCPGGSACTCCNSASAVTAPTPCPTAFPTPNPTPFPTPYPTAFPTPFPTAPPPATWFRNVNKHCADDDSGSYSTQVSAEVACSVLGSSCSGVYLQSCQGTDFSLCGTATWEVSTSGSCVYSQLSSLPSCSSTAINFDLPHTCSSGCIDASGGGGSCSTCQCPNPCPGGSSCTCCTSRRLLVTKNTSDVVEPLPPSRFSHPATKRKRKLPASSTPSWSTVNLHKTIFAPESTDGIVVDGLFLVALCLPLFLCSLVNLFLQAHIHKLGLQQTIPALGKKKPSILGALVQENPISGAALESTFTAALANDEAVSKQPSTSEASFIQRRRRGFAALSRTRRRMYYAWNVGLLVAQSVLWHQLAHYETGFDFGPTLTRDDEHCDGIRKAFNFAVVAGCLGIVHAVSLVIINRRVAMSKPLHQQIMTSAMVKQLCKLTVFHQVLFCYAHLLLVLMGAEFSRSVVFVGWETFTECLIAHVPQNELEWAKSHQVGGHAVIGEAAMIVSNITILSTAISAAWLWVFIHCTQKQAITEMPDTVGAQDEAGRFVLVDVKRFGYAHCISIGMRKVAKDQLVVMMILMQGCMLPTFMAMCGFWIANMVTRSAFQLVCALLFGVWTACWSVNSYQNWRYSFSTLSACFKIFHGIDVAKHDEDAAGIASKLPSIAPGLFAHWLLASNFDRVREGYGQLPLLQKVLLLLLPPLLFGTLFWEVSTWSCQYQGNRAHSFQSPFVVQLPLASTDGECKLSFLAIAFGLLFVGVIGTVIVLNFLENKAKSSNVSSGGFWFWLQRHFDLITSGFLKALATPTCCTKLCCCVLEYQRRYEVLQGILVEPFTVALRRGYGSLTFINRVVCCAWVAVWNTSCIICAYIIVSGGSADVPSLAGAVVFVLSICMIAALARWLAQKGRTCDRHRTERPCTEHFMMRFAGSVRYLAMFSPWRYGLNRNVDTPKIHTTPFAEHLEGSGVKVHQHITPNEIVIIQAALDSKEQNLHFAGIGQELRYNVNVALRKALGIWHHDTVAHTGKGCALLA